MNITETIIKMSSQTWKAQVRASFPEAIIKSTVLGTLVAIAPHDEVGRFWIKRGEGWIAGVTS